MRTDDLTACTADSANTASRDSLHIKYQTENKLLKELS